MTADSTTPITIGVLALQGAFQEHLDLLKRASLELPPNPYSLSFIPVRTAAELDSCSALIIPGGESTTIALIAQRCNLLEPLRKFVKVLRKPTWGTCAGMILLAESANRTKVGGQELIGGLDVRVNRNHFGRQVESFVQPLSMSCLGEGEDAFPGVFIRAPVVESILPKSHRSEEEEVHAPSRKPAGRLEEKVMEGQWEHVEVLGELPAQKVPDVGQDAEDRLVGGEDNERTREKEGGCGNVVAVRQGNVVGTSFHPELTVDGRLHRWWLMQVVEDLERRKALAVESS